MSENQDREGKNLLDKIINYQEELNARDVIRNVSKDLPKDKKTHEPNNSIQWLIVCLLGIGACFTIVSILPKHENKPDNTINPSVNSLPNLPINSQ